MSHVLDDSETGARASTHGPGPTNAPSESEVYQPVTPDPLTRLQRAVAERVDALCDYIGVPRLDNVELTEDDMP
jgi:hypothetical protein